MNGVNVISRNVQGYLQHQQSANATQLLVNSERTNVFVFCADNEFVRALNVCGRGQPRSGRDALVEVIWMRMISV